MKGLSFLIAFSFVRRRRLDLTRFDGGQLSHSAKHLYRNHHGIRRVPVKPIIIDLDIFEKLCSYNGSRVATIKAFQFTL